MKTLVVSFFFFFYLLFSINTSIGQPLNCAGADSNKIFFLGSDSVYRFDPALPLSATNPIAFIVANAGNNGLAISNNLNGTTPSPTFYTVNSNGEYEYWNGSAWINTLHNTGNGGAVNIGGGIANIYNYVGSNNAVYKYTGAGTGTFLGTVQGAGPYDFATDILDNFYFFDANSLPGHIYKYSPTATLLDSILVTGFPTSSAGGGFAYLGNTVMASFSGSDIWLGNVVANSVALTSIGNISFTVSDVAQCPTATQIPSSPKAKITVIDTTCGSLCVTPTDASTGVIASYQWSFVGGTPSTSAVANPGQICYTASGAHVISLIIIDTAGVSDTVVKTIYVSNAKTVISSPNQISCKPNQAYPLLASGANTYVWSPTSNLSCINCNNPIASPAISTTYIVAGTDLIGCTTKDTVSISIIPLQLNWIIPNDTFCLNELLLGSSISTGANISQIWNVGDGTSNISGSSINPPHLYTTAGIFDLKLIVTDTLGCKDSLTQKIYVASLPVADFTPYPLEAPIDVPLVNYNNLSTNAISYSWVYNNQLFSTSLNATKLYTDTGVYCVTLVACNELNCCDTILKCSSIVDQVLGVPNAFTPDGNTVNNEFKIIAKNIEVNYIKIFDRWGNPVFSTTNKSEGWNGTVKNKPCEMGTYFYVIEYKKRGKNKLLRGDLLLIR